MLPLIRRFAHRLGIALAAIAMFASQPHSAQAQEPAPMITAEQAREEVNLVYARILGRHPEPYWHTPESEWREVYQSLIDGTEPVSHETHYFNLARFMALTFDTHVQIYPEADTPGFETSYPLRFRLFEEGVFITAADDPYRDWVGYRLVSIAGQPIDEILTTLEAVSFSDHAIRKRSWAAEYLLPHPATYRHFGWAGDDGSIAIVLQPRGGSMINATLENPQGDSYDTVSRSGTNAAYYWPAGWRTLHDLTDASVPISRSNLAANYWFTDIADGEIIYVQLNRPFNVESGESLFQFWLRLFQHIEDRDPAYRRMIFDVRYNLGGSISFSLPAAYMAHATSLCCEPGGQVLLIGRETISAGAVSVGSFEQVSRPVTIGEPTGSRPNIFLNHDQIPLPHSGLFAEASTSSHTSTVASDRRIMIAPDIHVPERIEDVLAGRDAVLDTAIALTNEEAEGFYTRGRDYQSWIRPSQDSVQPQ
jgi:hypothetical protein